MRYCPAQGHLFARAAIACAAVEADDRLPKKVLPWTGGA